MGSGGSGNNVGNTVGSRDDGFPTVNGRTTKVHEGKQGKHLPGHNNYIPGRGKIDGGMEAAQKLILEGAGKGTPVGINKERVDYGRIIGTYKNQDGVSMPTTVGMINYEASVVCVTRG